jgi:hypothetical protein
MSGECENYKELVQEVKELLDYHYKCQLEMEATEESIPERQQIIAMLADLLETVHGFEGIPARIESLRNINSENLKKSRTSIHCAKCDTERSVTILGEEPDEEHGWQCDHVKCTHCGWEFRNPMPNNWPDRLQFFDHLLEEMEKTREDGSTVTEQFNAAELVKAMRRNTEKFKKELARHEQQIELISVIRNKAAQAMVKMRDFLLFEKINGMTWRDPGSFLE